VIAQKNRKIEQGVAAKKAKEDEEEQEMVRYMKEHQ
jgi:hypothetical protein